MGPKLQYTKDFSKFELHPQNRDLHSLELLKESISRHGFMPSRPIQVTNGGGKYHVISGHHRLAAAEALGVGVWFVVDDTSTDIFSSEALPSVSWSLKDFVTAYAKAGKDEYSDLIEFSSRHKIPVSIAALLLSKPRAMSYTDWVKRGLFKAENMALAEETLRVATEMFNANISFARDARFLRVLIKVLQVPGVDFGRLIHASRMYPTIMRRAADFWTIVREIDKLYNYHAQRRVRIEEGMRELRSSTFSKAFKGTKKTRREK